jgi:hypothetical protein
MRTSPWRARQSFNAAEDDREVFDLVLSGDLAQALQVTMFN